MKIARKLTDIGSDDYIDTFLKATPCIFMQQGQFHQLIHQAGVSYTLFHGGFMQTMQLANDVKSVQGDSVKIKFQDHEQFMLKLYRGVRDF